MADHSKTFEVTIAALGLVVTGMLGYGQFQVSQEQTKQARAQQLAEEKRAVDNIEVQVMSLVAPHLGNLAKHGTEFDSSQRVVLAAAEYLSTQHSRTALASMASKISEGNTAIPQEVRSRIQEATVTTPSTGKWFAVLASFPSNDLTSAQSMANQRLKQLKTMGLDLEIQLFKTKISNNLAVVVGGPVERTAALELAVRAQNTGVARDAFAQQDKGWIFIGKAPFK
jgi:hypothetical protein